MTEVAPGKCNVTGKAHNWQTWTVKGSRHRERCSDCFKMTGWMKTENFGRSEYSRASLQMLTKPQLHDVARKLGIVVHSKAPKQLIIDSIMERQ